MSAAQLLSFPVPLTNARKLGQSPFLWGISIYLSNTDVLVLLSSPGHCPLLTLCQAQHHGIRLYLLTPSPFKRHIQPLMVWLDGLFMRNGTLIYCAVLLILFFVLTEVVYLI